MRRKMKEKKTCRKKLRTALVAAAVAAMTLVPTVHALAVDTSGLSDAQSRLEDLQAQQAQIQAVIDGLSGERENLEEDIAALDQQMTDMTDEYNELTAQLEDISEQLEQSMTDTEQLEQAVDEQYEAMKLRIQFMYENGETGLLDLLFSSESLSDFLNRSEYIRELTGYDRDRLAEYETMVTDLAVKRVELGQLRTEIEEAQAELEVQQESLEMILAAKYSELGEYDREIGAQENILHSYDADVDAAASQVNSIVAQIEAEQRAAAEAAARAAAEEAARQAAEEAARQAAAAAETAETDENGNPILPETPAEAPAPEPAPVELVNTIAPGWVWPAPNCHTITDGYGQVEGRFHKGIDISMPGGSYGQPVVAACAGTVVLAQYSNSAGNWVVIYHGRDGSGNQLYSCYMHLSSINCSAGQQVSAGTPIGAIGATGMAYGAHLHFELRLGWYGAGGPTANPLSYVSP